MATEHPTGCPMCGGIIDLEAQSRICRSCPLYSWTRGCRLDLVRCPHCGYHSLPSERRAALPLPSTCRQPSAAAPGTPGGEEGGGEAGRAERTLNEVAVGREARLHSFNGLNEMALQRLVAYGLVPGVRLRVLQRRPATILKFRQTELALEKHLAGAIYVIPEGRKEEEPHGTA